jgi:hypothetical protein
MNTPIPCQHERILAFVSAYLAQEQISPTVTEIAVHIGYPYSTARRQVDAMVGLGLLVWPRHGLRREYWGLRLPGEIPAPTANEPAERKGSASRQTLPGAGAAG